MKKLNVKNFVKCNKKEILIGTGLVVIGGLVGYKVGVTKYLNMPVSFADAMPDGYKHVGQVLDCLEDGVKYGAYATIANPGFDTNELGKLGENIVKASEGVSDGMKFTHFIAIGK